MEFSVMVHDLSGTVGSCHACDLEPTDATMEKAEMGGILGCSSLLWFSRLSIGSRVHHTQQDCELTKHYVCIQEG